MIEKNMYEAPNLGYELSLENGVVHGNIAKYTLFK
jgi:hypothetical protein